MKKLLLVLAAALLSNSLSAMYGNDDNRPPITVLDANGEVIADYTQDRIEVALNNPWNCEAITQVAFFSALGGAAFIGAVANSSTELAAAGAVAFLLAGIKYRQPDAYVKHYQGSTLISTMALDGKPKHIIGMVNAMHQRIEAGKTMAKRAPSDDDADE